MSFVGLLLLIRYLTVYYKYHFVRYWLHFDEVYVLIIFILREWWPRAHYVNTVTCHGLVAQLFHYSLFTGYLHKDIIIFKGKRSNTNQNAVVHGSTFSIKRSTEAYIFPWSLGPSVQTLFLACTLKCFLFATNVSSLNNNNNADNRLTLC